MDDTEPFRSRLTNSDYLDFLAESEKILGSSLNYKTTLRSVASLAVPKIADWISVDIFDEDGKVKQIAVAHKDPEKVKKAKMLRRQFPANKQHNSLINKIIKSKKTQFIPHVTDKLLEQRVQNTRHRKLLQSLGIKSVIATPLKVKGCVFGAITFVMAKSHRNYIKQDVHILEYFTDRAAQAIEHAMLYQESVLKQEKLDNLISQVPGIVWESTGHPGSEKEQIVYVSDYIRNLLGYNPSKLINNPKFRINLIHPDDVQKVLNQMGVVFEDGEEATIQYRAKCSSGNYLWLENRVGPIYKKNKIIGLRGVAMDVSERVEWEERRREFTNMVSHELRTPITSLNIYTTLLEKKFSEKGQYENVNSIIKMHGQINKLSELVEQLLDISQMELGKFSYNFSKYDLNKLVKKAIKKMNITYPDYQIDMQGKVSGLLIGDESRMEQAIENIIDNAIKYSPEIKKVEVILKKQKNLFCITIKDYGVGLSQSAKSKIFNKFYRGDTKERKTYPGLGVGLFFTSQIAKQHGGMVKIDDTNGKGTSFSLLIPQNEETYSSS